MRREFIPEAPIRQLRNSAEVPSIYSRSLGPIEENLELFERKRLKDGTEGEGGGKKKGTKENEEEESPNDVSQSSGENLN